LIKEESMSSFADAAAREHRTAEDALRLFDSLEPADVGFMLGTWRGSGFPTGHPMDGQLEATGWYGKQFVDAERVHPLLFHNADRTAAFPVNPARVPLGLRLPTDGGRSFHRLVLAGRPLLRTTRYTARLRATEHRGRLTATMIYDAKPINDMFRMVSDDTVLGVMDLKGDEQPFFFVLERDNGTRVG
jgi:hypothetical protein